MLLVKYLWRLLHLKMSIRNRRVKNKSSTSLSGWYAKKTKNSKICYDVMNLNLIRIILITRVGSCFILLHMAVEWIKSGINYVSLLKVGSVKFHSFNGIIKIWIESGHQWIHYCTFEACAKILITEVLLCLEAKLSYWKIRVSIARDMGGTLWLWPVKEDLYNTCSKNPYDGVTSSSPFQPNSWCSKAGMSSVASCRAFWGCWGPPQGMGQKLLWVNWDLCQLYHCEGRSDPGSGYLLPVPPTPSLPRSIPCAGLTCPGWPPLLSRIRPSLSPPCFILPFSAPFHPVPVAPPSNRLVHWSTDCWCWCKVLHRI